MKQISANSIKGSFKKGETLFIIWCFRENKQQKDEQLVCLDLVNNLFREECNKCPTGAGGFSVNVGPSYGKMEEEY